MTDPVPRVEILDAIATYNEYHAPMATAELVDHAADRFDVRFEGPFCRTCCDYDYFEDLAYEFESGDVGTPPVEVGTIDYRGDERFVVEFLAPG